MEADIQAIKSSAEAAKLAAQIAATAAEKAATVASNASVNAATVNITLEYIKKDITEIKQTLKDQSANYVSHSEWLEHLKWNSSLDDRMTKVEGKQTTTEIAISNNRTAVYVTGVILTILFSIAQLFIYYIKTK